MRVGLKQSITQSVKQDGGVTAFALFDGLKDCLFDGGAGRGVAP